jgi:hypothetical protein
MKSLAKCMDIVSAEGYTQRRTSPSHTNHREKPCKVPTASTAGVKCWAKTCKPPYFYAVDKRAVLMGAVGNHPLAVDTGRSTDRKKDLQNATLRTVRSMRSVFTGEVVLPCRSHPTDKGSLMPL